MTCTPGCAPRKSDAVSLSDYAKGFGGKYGVQKDRMDKVSVPAGRAFLPVCSGMHGAVSLEARAVRGLGWRWLVLCRRCHAGRWLALS